MNDNTTSRYLFPLFVIGMIFFTFGFITWANSQLILYFRLGYALTHTQSYLVDTAFFAAYFFMSIPSSFVLERVGYKKSLALGMFLMGLGALLFIPAAMARSYPLFLGGLFVIGIGLALAQTAANPYVTILGPQQSAAQRMSIMGICNKLAGIIAVYVLGAVMLKDSGEMEARIQLMDAVQKEAYLHDFAGRIINIYIVIAAVFILLSLVLMRLSLPEVQAEEASGMEQGQGSHSIFRHRNLVLGALAIFFYVGAEVISYGVFSDFGQTLGFDINLSKVFPTYTGFALIVGYFITISVVPRYISQRKALIVSTLASIALLVMSVITDGWLAVTCFALLGLTQSVMWPAIWPLALAGLGKHTKLGGAILVMMIVGGAVLPPLMGVFASWMKTSSSAFIAGNALKFGFLIMIPCWLFILYYAVSGYRSRFIRS